MNEAPITAVIGFLIDVLGLNRSLDQNYIEIDPVSSPESPISPQNPTLPRPPFTFPLPPTNPNYTPPGLGNPFFPPAADPIDPNDRNQNGIPDDIDALLG